MAFLALRLTQGDVSRASRITLAEHAGQIRLRGVRSRLPLLYSILLSSHWPTGQPAVGPQVPGVAGYHGMVHSE
jgi:hypothetical protein